MDKLLLNKHPWYDYFLLFGFHLIVFRDPTRVRNKLSYELLQRVDNMPSQFAQFVNLTVDNELYGVYTLVQEMDKRMDSFI